VKLLLDLNVLIDVACRWQDFPASLALYNRIVASPYHDGTLAACGYTLLYDVMQQLIGPERARAVVSHFRETLTLLPFTAATARVAHLLQMPDLEDACTAATAFEGRCDVIATRNIDIFITSPIPARTPEDLVDVL
jgi:hypothetical protein